MSSQILPVLEVTPEEWCGNEKLFWQKMHPQDVARMQRHLQDAAKAGNIASLRFRLRTARTGHWIHLEETRRARRDPSGVPQGYAGVWLDVTREAALERGVLATTWPETLGTLAPGLAHDINNVLTGVLSVTEHCLTQIDAAHPFHEGLTQIYQSSRQTAQFLQRFAQLSQSRPESATFHDLNVITTDALDLFRRLALRRVEMEIRLDETPLPVFVDGSALRQAILQLALTAWEAAPERTKLSIQTQSAISRPAPSGKSEAPSGSPGACFTLRHLGPSDLALADVAEDTFGTILPIRQATLWRWERVKRMAVQWGGSARFESAPTESILRLQLPPADQAEFDSAAFMPPGRPRRILLVGQPAATLQSLADFLDRRGFSVAIAGRDGLGWLLSNEETFDAVLYAAVDDAPVFGAFLSRIRRHRIEVKTILYVAAAHQEEWMIAFGYRVDRVIPADLSADAFLQMVQALW